MSKQVKVTIKDGNVSADFTGFKGRDCQHLDERVRPKDLEVEDLELKPEYHQDQVNTETETHDS